jgi:hypothetical protein
VWVKQWHNVVDVAFAPTRVAFARLLHCVQQQQPNNVLLCGIQLIASVTLFTLLKEFTGDGRSRSRASKQCGALSFHFEQWEAAILRCWRRPCQGLLPRLRPMKRPCTSAPRTLVEAEAIGETHRQEDNPAGLNFILLRRRADPGLAKETPSEGWRVASDVRHSDAPLR